MSDDTESLFSEASSELQEDVRADLADAEDALPDADDVWEPEGTNILGVLNQVQSSLDPDAATESLKEAQKSYLIGEKAGAFSEDEQAAFESRIESVHEAIGAMDDISDGVADLIPLFPELRGALDDVADGASEDTEDSTPDSSEDTDEEESEGDVEDSDSGTDVPDEDGDEDDGDTTSQDDSEEDDQDSSETDGSVESDEDAGDSDRSDVDGEGEDDEEVDEPEGDGDEGDEGDAGPAESWGSDDDSDQSSFA